MEDARGPRAWLSCQVDTMSECPPPCDPEGSGRGAHLPSVAQVSVETASGRFGPR